MQIPLQNAFGTGIKWKVRYGQQVPTAVNRSRLYRAFMMISSAGPRRMIHRVGKMQPTIGSIIFKVA
jgi:hypothetical protein